MWIFRLLDKALIVLSTFINFPDEKFFMIGKYNKPIKLYSFKEKN